ncbi:MAG TPA: hypothetical protein DEA75_21065 [Rhodobacteraceae bacterium]|nr:hypothetical protein [Paracoccaceae bacterium]
MSITINACLEELFVCWASGLTSGLKLGLIENLAIVYKPILPLGRLGPTGALAVLLRLWAYLRHR